MHDSRNLDLPKAAPSTRGPFSSLLWRLRQVKTGYYGEEKGHRYMAEGGFGPPFTVFLGSTDLYKKHGVTPATLNNVCFILCRS